MIKRDEYLNSTLPNWLALYEGRIGLYKAKYIISIVVDILVALSFPVLYLAHFHVISLRVIPVYLIAFMVMYVTTIKTRQSYLACKLLIEELDAEKQAYVSGSAPYAADDKASFNLFVKNTKLILSNSFPVLSVMPQGFSES